MTMMKVEYECGCVYRLPLVLKDHQLALHQPALIDQTSMLIDAAHDEDPGCPLKVEGSRVR